MRIFKHYVSRRFFFLGILEGLITFVAIYSGFLIRYTDIKVERLADAFVLYLPDAMMFLSVIVVTMFALGMYQKEYAQDMKVVFIRLSTSFILAFSVLSLIFYLFPDLKIWRSALAIAMIIAFVGIVLARYIFIRILGLARFRRRVLVLGLGDRAGRVEALEDQGQSNSFMCVGYLPANDERISVTQSRILSGVNSLAVFAKQHAVEEIVVAVEDRRGGLPVDSLLECKLNGIAVTDYPSFWEREAGRVDLDSLRPSWLIFSDGFRVGLVHSFFKRVFDVFASVVLLVFGLPLIVVAAIAIRLESKGPIFYRQERLGLGGQPFLLLQFRSMKVDAESSGVPQWAEQNDSRITRIGNFIRQTRIDEIPQILNVLRGDMSFVGPRPERSYFVEQLTQKIPYYFERHRVKPGITGWAQLNYSYGASIEDAKEKLKYDLNYIKNCSVFLDLIILMQTARVIVWPNGVR